MEPSILNFELLFIGCGLTERRIWELKALKGGGLSCEARELERRRLGVVFGREELLSAL